MYFQQPSSVHIKGAGGVWKIGPQKLELTVGAGRWHCPFCKSLPSLCWMQGGNGIFLLFSTNHNARLHVLLNMQGRSLVSSLHSKENWKFIVLAFSRLPSARKDTCSHKLQCTTETDGALMSFSTEMEGRAGALLRNIRRPKFARLHNIVQDYAVEISWHPCPLLL